VKEHSDKTVHLSGTIVHLNELAEPSDARGLRMDETMERPGKTREQSGKMRERDMGVAKRDEGAAKQDEGVAERDEGVAEQDEGAAEQDEGAARPGGGAARRDDMVDVAAVPTGERDGRAAEQDRAMDG
jgi:hypothetical protein